MNYLGLFLNEQDKLNVLINGEGWEEKPIDWYTALVGECCELIKEVRGDHWRNLDNVSSDGEIIGEAVDILHFLVARALSEGYSLYDVGNYLRKDLSQIPSKDNDVIHEIHDIHRLGFLDGLSQFKVVINLLGYELKRVYKHAYAKCVLNIFRQLNGYKEGNYTKVWGGLKDSVIVYNIAELSEDCGNIFKQLEELYTRTSEN